ARAEMVVKVKEPIELEWPCMRKGQVVFTYFHFAASEPLTRAVIKSGIVAIAYETVQLASGELPLLTPMSEVAGRMAVQEGAKYLEKVYGGSGILLGGVPGVLPAEVLIIGGGVVGTNAARMAAGLAAHVTLLDLSLDRLRYLSDVLPPNVDLLYSNRHNLLEQLRKADLVIGAVLLPGAKAPRLVRREGLKLMKAWSTPPWPSRSACRSWTRSSWYDALPLRTGAAVTGAGDERRAGLSVRAADRVHGVSRGTLAEGHGGLLERGDARVGARSHDSL